MPTAKKESTPRIEWQVTDFDALEAAYPTLVQTITKKVVSDKSKLYALVKSNHAIGGKIPGVLIEGEEPQQRNIEEIAPTGNKLEV